MYLSLSYTLIINFIGEWIHGEVDSASFVFFISFDGVRKEILKSTRNYDIFRLHSAGRVRDTATTALPHLFQWKNQRKFLFIVWSILVIIIMIFIRAKERTKFRINKSWALSIDIYFFLLRFWVSINFVSIYVFFFLFKFIFLLFGLSAIGIYTLFFDRFGCAGIFLLSEIFLSIVSMCSFTQSVVF